MTTKSNELTCLIGKALTEVCYIHDYVQLGFDPGGRLSVYNPIEACPSKSNLSDLIGLRVSTVTSDATHEALTFENGVSVHIDLRPESFSGPEAMNLFVDGRIVVWT